MPDTRTPRPVDRPSLEVEMLNWGRLLLDGIPFADLLAAQRRPAEAGWFDFWMQRATQYEEIGEQARDDGHSLSAGEWLWLASLCCQYAQFLWFDERRVRGQARKAELYRRAAPLLSPPSERVDLPFGDASIPGYLRIPHGADGPVACAILLGGLESTKEESYFFENLMLARGVATCTFDGPGQGEMLQDVRLAPDFHRYTSAVVDHLVARERIDASRIGVLGRSLGGFYALQSACLDERLSACVMWGGGPYPVWETETPGTKRSWRYVSKVDTDEEAKAHIQRCLDCRDVLERLRCPTYHLHGALDEAPIARVETLQALAVNAPLTIVVEPEGDHCCHNLGPVPRVRMADWLADTLRG
jgi:2,6-dihydroxypseudooxynicotine hydrolase